MNHSRLSFFLDTTNATLKSTLKLLVQTEMRCERVRQTLNGRRYFDIEKAFEAIACAVNDRPTTGDDGQITRDDISSFLINRGYTPSQRQVDLFFRRLDRYGTGEPKLQDWKNEILPRTEVHV